MVEDEHLDAVQRMIGKGYLRIARNMLLDRHEWSPPCGVPGYRPKEERVISYLRRVDAGELPPLPTLEGLNASLLRYYARRRKVR